MPDREIRYCTTSDGVSIAYVASGNVTGPPLITMPVPGFSHAELSWQMFGAVQAPLEASYSMVTYDARGSGLSDRSAIDYSLDAMLCDFDAVVERSGFDKFALLAFISGGPAAIKYAATHPDRVTHLILADGWSEFAPIAVSPAYLAGKPLLDADWTLFTETFGQVLWAFNNPEFGRLFAQFMREASNQEAMRAVWKAWETYDVTEHLPQIKAPTLVIQNKNSRWFTVDIGRRLAGAIPNARLVLIDDITYSTVPGHVNEFLEVKSAEPPAPQVAEVPEPQAPPSEPALASGFRAVLFTDLVGHTGMMSRLGDEKGREVLRDHERITRGVLAEHGGTEIKTMGDGFLASFGSVVKAVDCAISLQRAIDERNNAGALDFGVGSRSSSVAIMRGDGGAEDPNALQVRVGLSAGEPIEEDGDLFGSTVILASRIAGKAEGGEILVANAVRELCAGKGFLFADRGEFVPRGFEDPVRVYEVKWRE